MRTVAILCILGVLGGCSADEKHRLAPAPNSIMSTCPLGWVNGTAVQRVIDDAGGGPKTQYEPSNAQAAQGKGAIARYDGFPIPWPGVIRAVKLHPAPTWIDQIYVDEAVAWSPALRPYRQVIVHLSNPEGYGKWFALWSSDPEPICVL